MSKRDHPASSEACCLCGRRAQTSIVTLGTEPIRLCPTHFALYEESAEFLLGLRLIANKNHINGVKAALRAIKEIKALAPRTGHGAWNG